MLVLFALVLSRVGGLFLGSPLLSRQDVPTRFRVALALTFSAAIVPALHPAQLPVDAVQVAGGLVSELLLGLAIGVTVRMTLIAFQLAGALTSTQMGLSLGSSFDPDSGDVMPELATFQLSFATLLFVLCDGHHFLLRSVAASFQIVPPGATLQGAALAELVSNGFQSMFELGARVAAPVSGLLLLINGLIGFLNRVAPQLSIFNVGFPLTIAAGFLATIVSLPGLPPLFLAAQAELEHALGALIGP